MSVDPRIIQWLDEKEATFVSFANTPDLKNKELIRLFKPKQADDLWQKALDAADAYISFDGGAEGSPRRTITNPQAAHGANNETIPGLFRLSSNRWDVKAQGIVQTLRLGYATAIDWAEAMLATGQSVTETERTVQIIFRSIDPAHIDDCTRSLIGLVYLNPVVQGETLPGSWQTSAIQPQQADDGSQTLLLTLARVSIITSAADLAALTAVRERVRDINNPFGREGGYTAHEGRSPTEGITLTYPALSSSSRTVLEALTDAEVQGLLPADDQLKFEMVKKVVDEDKATHILTLACVYRWVPLHLTAPETDARLLAFGLNNQSGKIILKRSWPRMDPTKVQAIINGTDANPNTKVTAVTVTDPMADGKTYSGSYLAKLTQGDMTPDDGCELIQDLVLAGDSNVDVFLGVDPDHGSYEKYLFNTTQTAISAFLAAVLFPNVATRPAGWAAVNPAWNVSQVGITKATKITANSDDSLNLYAFYSSTAGLIHVELFTGSAPGKLTVDPSYYASEERAYGFNVPIANLKTYSDHYAKDPTPANNVNIQREFKETRRDAYTFDFAGIIRTITEKDTGAFVARDDAEGTETVRKGKDLTALTNFAVPGSPTAGTLVMVDVESAEDGGKNAVKKSLVEHDQETHRYEKNAAGTVAIEEHTAKSAVVADPTAPAVNVKVTVENAPKPSGLFKTKAKTETDIPDVTTVASKVIKNNGMTVETMSIGLRATSVPTLDDSTIGQELRDVAITDKGGINYKLIAKALKSGLDGVLTTFKSASIEVHEINHGFRLPNSVTAKGQITGWTEWMSRMFSNRVITILVTRQYYLTHPTITGTITVTALAMGGGETKSVAVIPVEDGLWAVETKTVTVNGWSRISNPSTGRADPNQYDQILLSWYNITNTAPIVVGPGP